MVPLSKLHFYSFIGSARAGPFFVVHSTINMLTASSNPVNTFSLATALHAMPCDIASFEVKGKWVHVRLHGRAGTRHAAIGLVHRAWQRILANSQMLA